MPNALPGQGNPLYEACVLLLNGWGYNWYRQDNQLREDDLLVREHAGHFLIDAANALQTQESTYHRLYLPEPSREQPFPPSERLATHRLIREARQSLLALEGKVRGLSVPPTDKVWLRYRNEVNTLSRLVNVDVQLIALARSLAEAAGRLSHDSWDNPSELTGLIDCQRQLEQLIGERGHMLDVPVY